MSFGMKTIRRIRNTEKLAHDLGFKFMDDPYDGTADSITLMPRDDELPDYARDAIIYTGDLETVYDFLRGMSWYKGYLQNILKLASHDQIHRKEQDRRNKKLVDKLKA